LSLISLGNMAKDAPADTTAAAWTRLLAASSRDSGDRADHLSDLKARYGSDLRAPIGAGVFFCGLAVVVFGVMY